MAVIRKGVTGIEWLDIRPSIPQPHRAEAALELFRRAEVYLWITAGNERHPYKVEVRLLDDGHLVERWTREFDHRGGGFNSAIRNYDEGRELAGNWITGAPLQMVRPGRGWTIEKGDSSAPTP